MQLKSVNGAVSAARRRGSLDHRAVAVRPDGRLKVTGVT
jgi:hypothetical protein